MREFPSPIVGRIFGINWCKEIAPIYTVFFYTVLRERERERVYLPYQRNNKYIYTNSNNNNNNNNSLINEFV